MPEISELNFSMMTPSFLWTKISILICKLTQAAKSAISRMDLCYKKKHNEGDFQGKINGNIGTFVIRINTYRFT